MRINVPNQITLGRLGLAIVFVVLLSYFDARQLDQERWLLHISFWIFLVAALLDIVDGQLARMLRSVTSFGRIIDPVVDKVMVCGAFVLFASRCFWNDTENISGVAPWMVVVILTRELLVSAVRSQAESEGREFGALWMGKLKMFVQSVAVCVVLGQLAWKLDGLNWLRVGSVWAAVLVTVVSTISYLHRARNFLLTSAALGGGAPAARGNASAPGPPVDRSFPARAQADGTVGPSRPAAEPSVAQRGERV